MLQKKYLHIYVLICSYVYLYKNDYLCIYIPLIYIIYTIIHRKTEQQSTND